MFLEDLFKYEKEIELTDGKITGKVLLRTISDGDRESTLRIIEDHERAEVERLIEDKKAFMSQARINDDDESKLDVLSYLKAKKIDQLSITDDLTKQKDIFKERFSKEMETDRDKVLSLYTDELIQETAFNSKFHLYVRYVVLHATRDIDTKEKIFPDIEAVGKLSERIINQIFLEYSTLEPSGEDLKNSQPPTTT